MSTRETRITERLLDAIRDYAVLQGVPAVNGDGALDQIQSDLMEAVRERVAEDVPAVEVEVWMQVVLNVHPGDDLNIALHDYLTDTGTPEIFSSRVLPRDDA